MEKIFFPRDLHLGPTVGSYADNSSGANSFDDKIGFEMDLYAAAAQGNLATRLLYSKEFTTRGHVSGAIVARSVLQGVFRTIDLPSLSLSEVGVK